MGSDYVIYMPRFHAAGVDGRFLISLDDETLCELGVAKKIHRKRILDGVKRLTDKTCSPTGLAVGIGFGPLTGFMTGPATGSPKVALTADQSTKNSTSTISVKARDNLQSASSHFILRSDASTQTPLLSVDDASLSDYRFVAPTGDIERPNDVEVLLEIPKPVGGDDHVGDVQPHRLATKRRCLTNNSKFVD